MKKICSVLATLTLILGFAGALILAKNFGASGNIYTPNRNWGVTLGIFFGTFFPTIILSVILFAISEILENQEIIMASNKQVSPTLLGSLEKEAEEKDILSNGGWKCPKCGNVNRSYTNTCKCGAKKKKMFLFHLVDGNVLSVGK